MAIKQGLLERGHRGLHTHLGDLTGSFKALFAVLGGFILATCALVPSLGREAPQPRAQ